MTPTLSPFTILLNARRIQAVGFASQPNWIIACEMFNVGSTSAIKICNEAGIDPNAYNISSDSAPRNLALQVGEDVKIDRAYKSFITSELDGFAHTAQATRKAFEAGVRLKRYYLSGPMTGIQDLNFPAFDAAAAHLRAQGKHIINPTEINADKEAKWSDCLRADIVALMHCHTVYRLPGWENSRGARLELHIAEALGMEILDFERQK